MEENKFGEIAKSVKYASKKIAALSSEIKNKALLNIAKKLEENKQQIFEANIDDFLFSDFNEIGTSPLLKVY